MNKLVDILSQKDFARAEPAGERLRRDAPRAIKVVLPVWGYSYVRQFLECGLPTLLSPGNIPALAAALPTEFLLLTSEDAVREAARAAVLQTGGFGHILNLGHGILPTTPVANARAF